MWRAEIRRVAAQQHGVIAGHQIRACGVDHAHARRELAGHAWRRVATSVWVLEGSVATSEQRTMVGLLAAGPGAVLSHHSAAALWGVAGFSLAGPRHVSRCRGSNSTTPDGVVVHRLRRLPAHHVTTLDGFPTVRPARLPIELAALVHPARVERIIDDLWSRRLVSGRSLRAALEELSQRGRPGLAVVRAILADRPDGWVPPASGLEARVAEQLRRHNLPGFERQVDLGADDWVGRVDFVHRARRLVVEVQSDRYHAAISDRRADRRRITRLQEAGWTVVEVWESEVWSPSATWLQRLHAHLALAA